MNSNFLEIQSALHSENDDSTIFSQQESHLHHFQHTARGSNWKADFAFEYDYCVVFPVNEMSGYLTDLGHHYVQKLKRLGIELWGFKSKSGKEIFALIRAPINTLRNFADDTTHKMLLDPVKLKELANAGNPEKNIAPFDVPDNKAIVKFDPYQFIYGEYSKNVAEELYYRNEEEDHPFDPLTRLKLTALIIESKPKAGGEPLKIRRYLRTKAMLGFFPLHDQSRIELLEKSWLNLYTYPWKLDFDGIREYFGEKIALYFVFMGHMSKWLAFPAFASIPCQISIFVLNDFSSPFLPGFSFLTAIWAIFVLEYWKRREVSYALQWGTLNFEEIEQDRPDFRGEDGYKSVIDGTDVKYYPPQKKRKIIAVSSLAVSGLILVVIGIVTSIYVIRFALVNKGVSESDSQFVASILNAIQLQITNAFFSFLARVLTDWENHRTNTEYEDATIIKLFAFQFVNSYASFFYIAFAAERLGECAKDSCMKSLAENLGIIFLSRIVTNRVFDLYTYLIQRKNKKSANEKEVSRPEREFLLAPYDSLDTSMVRYTSAAIEFGYMALFVSALPVVILAALLSNLIESKAQAYQMLHFLRRPIPESASSIGTWKVVLFILSTAAVITNAGLTVFTMTTFDQFSLVIKLWIFILFQWICFTVQLIVQLLVPSTPEDIKIQQQRTDFLVDKLIKFVSDNSNDIVSDDSCNQPLLIGKYPSYK